MSGLLKRPNRIALLWALVVLLGISFLPVWTLWVVVEWEAIGHHASLWAVMAHILQGNGYASRGELVWYWHRDSLVQTAIILGIGFVAGRLWLAGGCLLTPYLRKDDAGQAAGTAPSTEASVMPRTDQVSPFVPINLLLCVAGIFYSLYRYDSPELAVIPCGAYVILILAAVGTCNRLNASGIVLGTAVIVFGIGIVTAAIVSPILGTGRGGDPDEVKIIGAIVLSLPLYALSLFTAFYVNAVPECSKWGTFLLALALFLLLVAFSFF
jgi:hypothetical protein